MKKFVAILLVLAFGLLLCACDEGGENESLFDPAGAMVEYKDVSDLPGMFAFSHKLLNACSEEGENLLLSPLSVNIALSMAANGAEGETLEQMKTLLADGRQMEAWNGLLMGYVQSLMSRKDSKLHVANGILAREGVVTLTDTFSEGMRTKYGAQIASRPFDDETLALLNDWVNTNTDGMIPELMDRFSDEAMLYLINVLLLEVGWASPYRDSQLSDGIFTAADGSRQNVTMMSSGNNTFYQWKNATGTSLQLQDGYSMMVMLPEEGKTPEEVLAELSVEELGGGMTNSLYAQVSVKLPKFSMDYSTELKDVLISFGMEKAFDKYAQFSPMGSAGNKPLMLNSVIHKTALELDENGIKAAAVTAGELGAASAKPPEEKREVILDRPFVFMIFGKGRVPIFVGIVNHIEN